MLKTEPRTRQPGQRLWPSGRQSLGNRFCERAWSRQSTLKMPSPLPKKIWTMPAKFSTVLGQFSGSLLAM